MGKSLQAAFGIRGGTIPKMKAERFDCLPERSVFRMCDWIERLKKPCFAAGPPPGREPVQGYGFSDAGVSFSPSSRARASSAFLAMACRSASTLGNRCSGRRK